MRRHRDGRGYVHVSKNTAELIAGEVDLGEWDDEELWRGYTRAKDGSFRGRPPSVVPIGVYQEFVRRQLQRAEQGFVENVAATVAAVAAIAADPEVDASTRLKAAEMIWDRVWGKPKERVELGGTLEVDPAWRRVIAEVTISRNDDEGWAELEAADRNRAGDTVDAEVVDEDDDGEFVFD